MGQTIIDRLLLMIDAKTDKLANAIKDPMKQMNKLDEKLGKALGNFQGFALGVGLSFLFTGMAIKNFFQRMLQSIFETFLLAEGETGQLNEKMNELKARLEIIKYKLASAFIDSGLLEVWLERLDKLINKFDEMDPVKRAKLVDFAVKATIVGGVLMVVGQVMLGLLGVVGVLRPAIVLLGKAFIWLAANPVIILIAAIALAILWIAKLASKFDSFGAFMKNLMAGVIKIIILMWTAFFNFIYNGVEKMINAFKKVAKIAGKDSLVEKLSQAEVNLAGMRANLSTGSLDLINQVEGWSGSRAVREQQASSTNNNNLNINVEGSIISENQLRDTIQSQLNTLSEFTGGSPST